MPPLPETDDDDDLDEVDEDGGLDPDVIDDPGMFREALLALRRRLAMTRDEWDALDEESREYAFTVAGVAQADIVQQVMDGIDDAMATGKGFKEFQDEIQPVLEDAWAGSVANPASRVETIFRTNMGDQYNTGRYEQQEHPAVKETFGYRQLVGIRDQRTSDFCRPVLDIVLPADHPFWQTGYPPRHYQCRDTTRMLTEAEAKRVGITASPPDVPAQPGFGRAPALGSWTPDLGDYDYSISSTLSGKIEAGAPDDL